MHNQNSHDMEKQGGKYDFSLYEYHNLLHQNILVSYKGPIDERIMSVIGENIEIVSVMDLLVCILL